MVNVVMKLNLKVDLRSKIFTKTPLANFLIYSNLLFQAISIEKFIGISFNEFDLNPLCCVSLAGYTWQRGLKYTDIKSQTPQDKELIFSIEKSIRGSMSSVLGDGCYIR